MQDYIIAKLRGTDKNQKWPQYSDEECQDVFIYKNTVNFNTRLRINYTSYDVRRHQDVINPKLHADFMVLSGDPRNKDAPSCMTEPYWFARALKIGHVYAKLRDMDDYRRIDFVWARWFELDETLKGGWSFKRPPIFSFTPATSNYEAFGFMDPAHIVRAVHMIPVFAHGRTPLDLPALSIAHEYDVDDADSEGEWEDWEKFYLNM